MSKASTNEPVPHSDFARRVRAENGLKRAKLAMEYVLLEGRFETLLNASTSAIRHWDEFGADHGHEEVMDRLRAVALPLEACVTVPASEQQAFERFARWVLENQHVSEALMKSRLRCYDLALCEGVRPDEAFHAANRILAVC